MNTTVNKPATTQDQDVINITAPLNSKTFTAVIFENGQHKGVSFSIQPLLDQMTAGQKTTVREWYKRLAVLAVNEYNAATGVTITETDLIGDALID